MKSINMSKGATSKNTISEDALLKVLVIIIPLLMSYIMVNEKNPYIDSKSLCMVFLISLCVFFTIHINQKLQVPLLRIFLIVYIFFWHIRFLTLVLFPSEQLVLTRTVLVTPEFFSFYAQLVFISLLATIIGLLISEVIFRSYHNRGMNPKNFDLIKLAKFVKKNLKVIFFYCFIAYGFLILSTQYSLYTQTLARPIWIGYLSFLFPFELTLFLVCLVLINNEVPRSIRVLFLFFIVIYIGTSLLVGSRSYLFHLILRGLFLTAILGKGLTFKFRHFCTMVILGLVIIASFLFGTYIRQWSSQTGFTINKKALHYATTTIYQKGNWEQMLGLAAARAGYLDFSAEMIANSEYAKIITLPNLLKGAIDSYIPGDILFDDGRLVEHRIRDVYNPSKLGYQSDAIGLVGENYILFGFFSPLIILVFSGFFSFLYNFSGYSVCGLYIKFMLAVGMMTWWNSYGYDWLVFSIGTQLIVGFSVISTIIFFSTSLPIKKFFFIHTINKKGL